MQEEEEEEEAEAEVPSNVGGISPRSFYKSSSSRKRKSSKVDPRMMFREVKVKLEKLPLREAMAVNEDLFAKIKVSPPRKRPAPAEKTTWFSKKSRMGPRDLSPAGTGRLIRPPILNVTQRTQISNLTAADSKFSPSKDPIKTFVPLSKSLFDGTDDFEKVPDDEVIIDDEEDDEEDEEEDEDEIEILDEVEKKEEILEVDEEKEGFEPVIDPKAEDLNEDSRASSLAPATIPLLARLKKEEPADAGKIRFPVNPGNRNGSMIECRWTGCQMEFNTYGKLSDHLRVSSKLEPETTTLKQKL